MGWFWIGWNGGVCDKRLYLGYILKIECIGYVDESVMGNEGNRNLGWFLGLGLVGSRGVEVRLVRGRGII